ncbi:MAG TPA: response regulator transcription factor [Gemmataceae bacterium]|nr:response regulator transcription factor [Gemmataceae bacterium]
MPRLLIVEDERKILRSLERGLQADGYEIVTAANGEAGYQLASTQTFDCVVLDLMLPGRDGLQVLADLRRQGKKVPVLILTARDAVEDRVVGLDAGADDYLVKPFAFAELLARLRVLLRRGRSERETVLVLDDLEMDLLERRVTRGGAQIELTHREFELLEYLLRHKNTTVTRAMLGRDVWKEEDYALTNVIDVFINALRKKVEQPGKPPLIQTIRGVGYSLGTGALEDL